MKTKKNNLIKIVFVLPDLSSGGAERVMSFVASNISKSKFDTSIWVAGYEKNTVYNINSVKVKYFNKSRVLKAIPNLIIEIWRHNPDIVISSIAHLNSALALMSIFFPKTKFIGREANVLSVLSQYSPKSVRFGNILSPRNSYKLLDLIICQSKDMYNDMHEHFKIPNKKLVIINNPITDNFELKPPNSKKKDKFKFITVAALKKQKGHARVLKVLSELDIPFHYTIIGKGSELENITLLIDKFNLNKNITHIPYTNEVSKHLSNSDFFLQGSYVEGFPNCLIESCAVGTPVLAFDAPGGLDEIIEPEINGLIAKNDEEFKNNIIKAINNYNWNPILIRQSVYNKFNKEKIIRKYEDLFIELLKI